MYSHSADCVMRTTSLPSSFTIATRCTLGSARRRAMATSEADVGNVTHGSRREQSKVGRSVVTKIDVESPHR